MDKKEKEARLEEHIKYWELVDKIRDVSVKALDDLPVNDVISVLDRVKIELVQEEAIVLMQEAIQSASEGEQEEESEEGAPAPPQVDLQTTMPLVDSGGLSEAIKRATNN